MGRICFWSESVSGPNLVFGPNFRITVWTDDGTICFFLKEEGKLYNIFCLYESGMFPSHPNIEVRAHRGRNKVLRSENNLELFYVSNLKAFSISEIFIKLKSRLKASKPITA